jgi:hypothetical protein
MVWNPGGSDGPATRTADPAVQGDGHVTPERAQLSVEVVGALCRGSPRRRHSQRCSRERRGRPEGAFTLESKHLPHSRSISERASRWHLRC